MKHDKYSQKTSEDDPITLSGDLTLLPGNVWLVPELGRVLDKLDIQSVVRTSICNENKTNRFSSVLSKVVTNWKPSENVLTRNIEPWEVREGVEVSERASSSHRRHYLPVQCAIGMSSIRSVATGHAPLFWKLGLEARGWAALPEPYTHPHHPPILEACRRDGEGGSGWSLVAWGAALPRQVPMSLIWGGVAAVHRVTVQTGASLGHLWHRRVTAQNRTSLGVCDRRLSAEYGAALHGLTQGRLSTEDRAPLRPLSQRDLSAEDRAILSPRWKTPTQHGTATWHVTRHAHIITISCWCLLTHDWTVLVSARVLLQDGTVSGAIDVGPLQCMGTSMAECGLGGFWGGRARVWGPIAPQESVWPQVRQCRGGSAMVEGGWRAGIKVGGGGSVHCLIGGGRSGVGTVCGLGAEAWISSGLGRSANTALC